ncbi:hypothetical protein BJ546DRAFT_7699 [Cryomyces antarcticus]
MIHLLVYGYNDDGPTPPYGLRWCKTNTSPWTWCDSKSGDIYPDTVTHQESLPIYGTDVSGLVCSTYSSASCPTNDFAAMFSIDGSAVLHHAFNGNIYSFNEARFPTNQSGLVTSRLFSGVPPFITGGSGGRLLHGYKDTLAKYGVSRLRLSHARAMPNTSMPVALVPAYNPLGGPSILTAADTSSNVYCLITCQYENMYSKIFIGTAYFTGIIALTDPALEPTVTGGKVTGCSAVPYTDGQAPM